MLGELRLGGRRADDGNVSWCGSGVEGSDSGTNGCQHVRQEIKAEGIRDGAPQHPRSGVVRSQPFANHSESSKQVSFSSLA